MMGEGGMDEREKLMERTHRCKDKRMNLKERRVDRKDTKVLITKIRVKTAIDQGDEGSCLQSHWESRQYSWKA